jgi:hypothetical protein
MAFLLIEQQPLITHKPPYPSGTQMTFSHTEKKGGRASGRFLTELLFVLLSVLMLLRPANHDVGWYH